MQLETIPCNFCGDNNTAPFLQQDGFNIVQCTQCGLFYVNPRPRRADIGAYYTAGYYAHSPRKGFAGSVQRWRQKLLLAIAFHQRGYPAPSTREYLEFKRLDWAILAALFKRRFNRIPPNPGTDSPPRALDIGSGSGAYLSVLQQVGWEAWGVEPDPAGVQLAWERGCPNVHNGTLEDCHFGEESFELVTCWDSLEHTYDPGFVLREAQRLLKPGGWLYIKVPHPECLEARLWRQDWVGYDLPRHLYHFTPRRLKGCMEQQGFVIDDFRYVSPPNVVASGLILGISRRWPRLAFLHRLNTWLTIACVPLAWLLDRLGRGNTFQIVARKKAVNV
jgi:SAM-dependent methyltransferase